ncbi:uncharacterized protein [Rutidosis leptorrhynchoides]|uniref:uncharacterized protein n=1 Tax=Rutidosis leptorrhynchoides TaxID=125765 RepID=UPI003A994105
MPQDTDDSSDEKATYKYIIVASSIGLVIGATVFGFKRKRYQIVPRIRVSDTGQLLKLEGFPHYVARQMGFSSSRDCPHLFKFAAEYITKTEGCEEEMYMFFAEEPDADSLFIKLVEEFERCILSYFAFHWSNAHFMISQALAGSDSQEPKKKLKDIVMQATREQRFERVTKNLKVARVFTTLVEEMKAIGLVSADDSQCTDVMVPMAHKDRSPVLLFMGGGMGAGKSTALKDILKEPFWAGASANAVVIEADAFKESDVIYRALSKRGHHDMLQTAELVHQSSTDAASSLLVTALNEGRDVIMDGTLSWVPFVVQTITMARSVHRKRYRMGAGYKVNNDGSVTERYWEQLEEESEPLDGHTKRRPYRIELVGVICDPYLAVIRGIRRAIVCRRAVRVRSQLTSHKRFATAFMTYCQLVDSARLYLTNDLDGPPKLIGWKEKERTLLIDPDEIGCLKMIQSLNEKADSIYELYNKPNPANESGSVWHDIVMSPSRLSTQKELKYSIQKIEKKGNTKLHLISNLKAQKLIRKEVDSVQSSESDGTDRLNDASDDFVAESETKLAESGDMENLDWLKENFPPLHNKKSNKASTTDSPDVHTTVSMNETNSEKVSYAKAIKSDDDASKLSFIPLSVDDDRYEIVVFDEIYVEESSNLWNTTAYGYVIGGHMSFGPWIVQGKPLFVAKWSPELNIEKIEPSKLPVWVKLTDMPLEAWNKKGISAIARKLGKPMVMDQMTTTMCSKGAGRATFARVMVEIDASKGYRDHVDIHHKDKHMVTKGIKKVNVAYDWKHALCTFCAVIGHNHDECKHRPRTSVELKNPALSDIKNGQDKDGFRVVQPKKYKEKNDGNKFVKPKQAYVPRVLPEKVVTPLRQWHLNGKIKEAFQQSINKYDVLSDNDDEYETNDGRNEKARGTPEEDVIYVDKGGTSPIEANELNGADPGILDEN